MGLLLAARPLYERAVQVYKEGSMMMNLFDGIFDVQPGQYVACDSFTGDGKRTFFKLHHTPDRSQLPYVELDGQFLNVIRLQRISGAYFIDLFMEYDAIVNLEAGDLFFEHAPHQDADIKVYYAIDSKTGPTRDPVESARRSQALPAEESLHILAASMHGLSSAGIINAILGKYALAPVATARETVRIPFDGIGRVWPLLHDPEIIIDAKLSDGTPLSVGVVGTSNPLHYDALINPSGPTIEFVDTYPQGIYAEITYDYDVNKAPPLAPGLRAIPQHMAVVPGWQEWDYQNYCDFQAAVREDAPVDFALCQWLMQNEGNETAFPGDQWEQWYQYARAHCPRFDKAEPRWRKQSDV
jgi:hypothetical protein